MLERRVHLEDKDLFEAIDKTIVSVCERVQGNSMVAYEYAETTKALAELVSARAELKKCIPLQEQDAKHVEFVFKVGDEVLSRTRLAKIPVD